MWHISTPRRPWDSTSGPFTLMESLILTHVTYLDTQAAMRQHQRAIHPNGEPYPHSCDISRRCFSLRPTVKMAVVLPPFSMSWNVFFFFDGQTSHLTSPFSTMWFVFFWCYDRLPKLQKDTTFYKKLLDNDIFICSANELCDWIDSNKSLNYIMLEVNSTILCIAG